MHERKAVRKESRTPENSIATRIVTNPLNADIRGRGAVTSYAGPNPAEYDAYEHEEVYLGDRWTHKRTGLQVELDQRKGPAAGEMTKASAGGREDVWYTMRVRPRGEPAAVSREIHGERADAIDVVEDWLADHPDGQLTGEEGDNA